MWVALAGTVLAFAVAAIVSGTTTPEWRAETTIVVGTGAGPLRPGEDGSTKELASRLDDLVRSDQIVANVISGLHLDESRAALLDRVSVNVPEPGLLRVRIRDENRLRAPQIAQQIGFLYPQLVQHRFPRLNAVVWDPPHLIGRTGRHWGRNVVVAAAVAALLWAFALLPHVRRLRLGAPAPAAEPVAPVAVAPERVVEPARPLAVAPPVVAAPAPEPVSVDLHSGPSTASPPGPETTEAAPSPPEPAIAASAPEVFAGPAGEWSFIDLERLVRERGGEFPGRREEWEIYLDSIRDYAGPEGQLPASLDWLVWETFGELLEGGRAT